MLLAIDVGNSNTSVGLFDRRRTCVFWLIWIQTAARRPIRSALT